jgi:hypothetical protein
VNGFETSSPTKLFTNSSLPRNRRTEKCFEAPDLGAWRYAAMHRLKEAYRATDPGTDCFRPVRGGCVCEVAATY